MTCGGVSHVSLIIREDCGPPIVPRGIAFLQEGSSHMKQVRASVSALPALSERARRARS